MSRAVLNLIGGAVLEFWEYRREQDITGGKWPRLGKGPDVADSKTRRNSKLWFTGRGGHGCLGVPEDDDCDNGGGHEEQIEAEEQGVHRVAELHPQSDQRLPFITIIRDRHRTQ